MGLQTISHVLCFLWLSLQYPLVEMRRRGRQGCCSKHRTPGCYSPSYEVSKGSPEPFTFSPVYLKWPVWAFSTAPENSLEAHHKCPKKRPARKSIDWRQEQQKKRNSLNKPVHGFSHVLLCKPFVLSRRLCFLKEALLSDGHRGHWQSGLPFLQHFAMCLVHLAARSNEAAELSLLSALGEGLWCEELLLSLEEQHHY